MKIRIPLLVTLAGISMAAWARGDRPTASDLGGSAAQNSASAAAAVANPCSDSVEAEAPPPGAPEFHGIGEETVETYGVAGLVGREAVTVG